MNTALFVIFSIKLILMIMLKNTLNRIKFLENKNAEYIKLLSMTRKYILPNTPLRKSIDSLFSE
jgi:hypothetical protein